QSPDARQSSRLRSGEDAQPQERNHDRESFFVRRQGREGDPRRGGNGISVRRRRVLLFHEHRKLRTDASDKGSAGGRNQLSDPATQGEGRVLRRQADERGTAGIGGTDS